MDIAGLGFRQLELIRVFIDYPEGATVRQLLDCYAGTVNEPTYTTVLTILQGLEARGIVKHAKGAANAYVYSLAQTHDETLDALLVQFASDVFADDLERLQASLNRIK